MKYSVSVIILCFSAVLNVAASTPDDNPDPGQDWQTFTISFDAYRPTIGPGTNTFDQVKNRNLNIRVNYPLGYQYTIYKSDYTVYALLELGVTLKQTSSYWFAGFVSDKPTFQSYMGHTMATTPSPILFRAHSGRHAALPPP
ncbi:hypothetical protein B9Z19DRAFT_1135791 [Tuber borchii]|uniref:Uncharacterized protein n=1 Tax=Tuber borchii TaxID=42251 RepID=A0A2T6ZC99_TUBBO|nr:hypothetical protein B9Z19DRAFT_1135791 [Tuber borchii]